MKIRWILIWGLLWIGSVNGFAQTNDSPQQTIARFVDHRQNEEIAQRIVAAGEANAIAVLEKYLTDNDSQKRYVAFDCLVRWAPLPIAERYIQMGLSSEDSELRRIAFEKASQLAWSKPKAQETGRVLAAALAQATDATNATQQVDIISLFSQIDPLNYDFDTRESLKRSWKVMLRQGKSAGNVLVALARFQDKQSGEVIREFLAGKSLEIPIIPDAQRSEVIRYNIALVMIGDEASIERISQSIRLASTDLYARLSPSMLSHRKIQLALLEALEHPDGRGGAAYDYEDCWSRRKETEGDPRPTCDWGFSVHLPATLLASTLGIAVKKDTEKALIDPTEARRIIKEARKKLFVEDKL